MSKISQREWNAIAARYAQGESISAIARTYGCTPPAIHYILKKSRRRAAPEVNQQMQCAREGAAAAACSAQTQLSTMPPASNEPARVATGQPPSSNSQHSPAMGQVVAAASERPMSAAGPGDQHRVMVHHQPPRPAGRSPAGSEALDIELHDRAEAAIETFRSCFDAALAEGSPRERARLREAASNLMRVAARTTIVLDRLNALSERSGFDRGSNGNSRI
jgi:transposase-like protein